jgi:hypothetical protein
MRARIALGTAILMLLAACYNTHSIRPTEVANLNGYTKDHPAEVHEWSGKPVSVTGNDKVNLTRSSGEVVGGHFDRIAVQGGRFVGRTDDGQVVNLLLPDIQEASIDKYSRGETLAGWIMTGVVVIGGILVLTLVSLQQSGHCPTASCSGTGGSTGP